MKKYWIIAVISLSALASCTEKIDLDLDDDKYQRLIVEGMITDELKHHRIHLTLTAPYDTDEQLPPATGALVSISDGTNLFTLTEAEPGWYQTDSIAGEVGKTYTLSINYNGKNYNANSVMYPTMMIDSISVEKFMFAPQGQPPHYEIHFWGQELPEPGQFYLMKYSINDVLIDSIWNYSLFNDFIDNGMYLDDAMVAVFDSEEDTLTVEIELYSIEESYFYFIDQCMMNTMPSMFFGGPPANIKGNISNSALGWFSASAVSRAQAATVAVKNL